MNQQEIRFQNALSRELQTLEKRERRMEQAAMKARPAQWKESLKNKIPDKVYFGLESAFCKGFSLVFDQGAGLIGKSLPREKIRADQAVLDFAVEIKGGRKQLKQVKKSAHRSDLANLTITTVEGLGLGALGVGMPDIVLFLVNLLRGVYETALRYGFDYTTRQEQLLILKMMAASLSTGQERYARNREVEEMLRYETMDISEEMFRSQLQATASVFSMDMLLLKFIQGLPVVGLLGGAGNPVYYSRVMKYVQLKYQKRYLLSKKA